MGECRDGGVGVQGWWHGGVEAWECRGDGMGEWRDGGVGVQ